MSWLSKTTGIHLRPGDMIGAAAGLLPGGGMLAGLARGAAALQRSKTVIGTGFGISVKPNNPFTHGGGLIGMLTGSGGKKGRVDPQDGRCPSGYHLNKHKLADGTEPRTVCVRNRHMNVANGRAIGRAVRRIHGAEKQYRHVFSIMHHHAPGKILPKKRHK